MAHLNGSAQKTGPSLLLKVMSGDSIDLGVHSYYVTQTGTGTNSSITDVMSSLASGLVSITAGTKGSVSQLTNPAGTLYSAISSFLTNSDPNPTGKPKAYLNWILLDDQLNPVSTYPQTGAIPVGNYTQATLGTPGQTGIPITKSGYLYVWVSNETAGWDVYFDNLSVTHHTGPLLEENHYYPFGLAMAAISSKALKTNYYENKFRFNGGSEMQNKEFSDGSGLEMYETPMRGYDAQIGRFGQIDPMAGEYSDYSSYAYCTNNPILFSDPTGARKFYFAAPQVFGSLSGGMDAPPLPSGGSAQSYWSSGSSGNSGITDAQSAVTALLSDAYANGGTWKNNGGGEGTITGFNSTDDAVIGGVSYLFYSGALGSGAAAQQTANNLVSQYNDANGGHAEGFFESLNAVTVIGHISSSGGWVTTNEADVAAQLRANGASGIDQLKSNGGFYGESESNNPEQQEGLIVKAGKAIDNTWALAQAPGYLSQTYKTAANLALKIDALDMLTKVTGAVSIIDDTEKAINAYKKGDIGGLAWNVAKGVATIAFMASGFEELELGWNLGSMAVDAIIDHYKK